MGPPSSVRPTHITANFFYNSCNSKKEGEPFVGKSHSGRDIGAEKLAKVRQKMTANKRPSLQNDPKGIRTLLTRMRIWCPEPLDDGAIGRAGKRSATYSKNVCGFLGYSKPSFLTTVEKYGRRNCGNSTRKEILMRRKRLLRTILCLKVCHRKRT